MWLGGFAKTVTWCRLTTRMEIGVAPGSHCMHTKDDNDDATLRYVTKAKLWNRHFSTWLVMMHDSTNIPAEATDLDRVLRKKYYCMCSARTGKRIPPPSRCTEARGVASPTPWLMRTFGGDASSSTSKCGCVAALRSDNETNCKPVQEVVVCKERMQVGDGSAVWCPKPGFIWNQLLYVCTFQESIYRRNGLCTNYQGSITNRLQSTT